MNTLALVIGILGGAGIVWVMVWLMMQPPQQSDLRTPEEWERVHRIRITGWEGFRDGSQIINEPMTDDEFIRRARASTYRPVPRQVADIGNGQPSL